MLCLRYKSVNFGAEVTPDGAVSEAWSLWGVLGFTRVSGLANSSQVDMLGSRYKSVNFEAFITPDMMPAWWSGLAAW
jgi:hypothetical protein